MSFPDDEIDFELLPYIRFYKSGRFERLSDDPICDPSPSDPITGVASKDVDINPAVPISARLFLPPTPSPPLKLPLLVYFHGGSFCYDSAFSSLYHSYLNSIASRAGVVIVSVNYRLAPENPLPAAYDDCWAALRWATASSDPWIAEHADLNRVFIAGDSSGGNIAQRMAVRGGAEGGVRIQGIALFNPYFSTGASEEWALVVKLWRAVCPGTVGGAADPRLYPAADKEAVKGMAGKRLVVFVAEEDGLRKADRAYYEAVGENPRPPTGFVDLWCALPAELDPYPWWPFEEEEAFTNILKHKMSEHTSQGYEQGEPSGLVFSGTNDNTSLHPYTGQWMAHWMQACKSWSSKECEKYHNTVRVGNKVEQFKGHECLAVEQFNSKEIKHLCLDLNQSYVSECKGQSSSTVGDVDLIPHVLHSGETIEHDEIMFSNSQKLTESFIKWKSAASYLFQNLDDFGSKNTHFPMFDINGKIETIMDSREESYYHDAMLDKSPVSSSLADLAPGNNCLIGNTEKAARFYDFFQPDLGCKCQKRKDTASCTFSCGPAFKVSANTELSCRQHESCCCSSSNKFISKGTKQNNDSVSRSFEISWTSPKDGSSHALQESSSNHFPCHFPTEKHDEMGFDRRQIEVMTGGTAFTQVKKIAFSETFTTRHYYSDKETATGPFENCTSEQNRRGHGGIGTHFTGINNEPSTSADTLYHNPFHRTSSTLGETFSRTPKSAASASQAQEASCRSADNGVSGRSEPPASTERATEDAAGQFFLCIKKAGLSDSTLLQNNASESESCSRWVKRLRHKPLSTDWFQTCDGSSSEVQNRCLEEKSIPLSDNNNPSSTDTEEALQPLIRNRRRNGRRPVAPVTFLPVNGKKFASIQAMALMGNLIKNYKPCKFQRKEASVIWTV